MFGSIANSFCQYNKLELVSEKIRSITKGSCEINFVFKPLLGIDTIRNSAYIEFDKSNCKADSVGKFLIKQNDSLFFYYDLDRYYFINSNNKSYEFKIIEDLPIYKMIKGTSINSIIHRPLFSCKTNLISLFKLGAVKLDDYFENSFSLRYVVNDSTGPITYIKIEFDKNYMITYYEENVHYLDNIQYKSISFKNNQINFTPTLDSSIKSLIQNYSNYSTTTNEELNIHPKYSVGQILDKQILTSILPTIDSKILLIDFFYRGCFPCLKSIPAIDSLLLTYSDEKIEAIGINSIDKPGSEFTKFIEKYDIEYPIYFDSTKFIVDYFDVKSYPTIYIVDLRNSTVIFNSVGYSESLYMEMKKSVDDYISKMY